MSLGEGLFLTASTTERNRPKALKERKMLGKRLQVGVLQTILSIHLCRSEFHLGLETNENLVPENS